MKRSERSEGGTFMRYRNRREDGGQNLWPLYHFTGLAASPLATMRAGSHDELWHSTVRYTRETVSLQLSCLLATCGRLRVHLFSLSSSPYFLFQPNYTRFPSNLVNEDLIHLKILSFKILPRLKFKSLDVNWFYTIFIQLSNKRTRQL